MSPTWAISPPGISIPARSAPLRRPTPIAPQTSGSASRQRMKSSIAIGSAPTQIRSLTFIAMQSMPIVVKSPSRSATSIFVPTPSVPNATPVRSSILSTLA